VLLVVLPRDHTYLSHAPPAALRDHKFLKRALTQNGLCLKLVPHPMNRQVTVRECMGVRLSLPICSCFHLGIPSQKCLQSYLILFCFLLPHLLEVLVSLHLILI